MESHHHVGRRCDFLSQSLVNEGRFPPRLFVFLMTMTDDESRNPSLMRAGFHLIGGWLTRWVYISRNPSLMRAGFHLLWCWRRNFNVFNKKSQSLVNEGRFPHVKSWRFSFPANSRNPSLMRAGFHYWDFLWMDLYKKFSVAIPR